MKRTARIVMILALFVCAALAALPASARVAPASDLQLTADGHSGVVMAQSGCTRITNRFCVQSTRSNCSACH